MSTTIRSLVIKVGADLTDMQKGFKQASKDLKNIGKNFSAAGSTLTKGLTLPIIGAITGLTGLAVNAGKTADELITLSNKTGLSTKALQEMEYAAKFIDVPLETMTASMQKLIKSMDGARKGTKDQVEAFNTLGVEYQNADGSLRDSEAVWKDTIDALGNMSNEAERNAMSLRLFGRSSQELNPLIVAGSEAINKYAKEARDLGLILSEEDVIALGKFDDAREKFMSGLKIVGMEIGLAFIPLLEKIMPVIQEKVIPAIQDFAGRLSGLIDKFMNASPEMQKFVLVVGAMLIAIGPILSLIGGLATQLSFMALAASGAKTAMGVGGLMTSFSMLLGPVGAVLASVAALVALIYVLYDAEAKLDGAVETGRTNWASYDDTVYDTKNSTNDLRDETIKENIEMKKMAGQTTQTNKVLAEQQVYLQSVQTSLAGTTGETTKLIEAQKELTNIMSVGDTRSMAKRVSKKTYTAEEQAAINKIATEKGVDLGVAGSIYDQSQNTDAAVNAKYQQMITVNVADGQGALDLFNKTLLNGVN